MVRVIGVGDNTVDKYLHLGLMFPGGNAVNVATLSRRYGHAASYIGRLGDDPPGRLILAALKEEGVDTSHCRVVSGPTSYSEVNLVDGDRVFGKSDHGVAQQIVLDGADLAFISQHDVTHTSIYSHLEKDLERLSLASNRLSFDFSNHWDCDYLSKTLPWVHIALLSNSTEAPVDAAELAQWAYRHGPTLVVVTQGKEGALAYDGKRLARQGIVPTNVVDTLGAGDAFFARFLVEHLGGASLEAALAAGAESAARTCTYLGAFGHGQPFA